MNEHFFETIKVIFCNCSTYIFENSCDHVLIMRDIFPLDTLRFA